MVKVILFQQVLKIMGPVKYSSAPEFVTNLFKQNLFQTISFKLWFVELWAVKVLFKLFKYYFFRSRVSRKRRSHPGLLHVLQERPGRGCETRSLFRHVQKITLSLKSVDFLYRVWLAKYNLLSKCNRLLSESIVVTE